MDARSLFLIVFLFAFQSPDKQVILFFGDSLTAGYGLSPEEAFPAVIEKTLIKEGKPVKVVNAGLSGETTAGGLSRLDWILRQKVDVFVLELGGNDGLRGLPVTETRKNLLAIIAKVKAKYPACRILLAGMRVPPNMGPDYGREYEKIFPEVASSTKVAFMPFLLQDVGGIERLNQADGIHPTVEGHRIVAGNLIKYVRPLLKS